MRLGEPDHALELPRRRVDALLVGARVLARLAEGDVAADELVSCGFGDGGVNPRASVGDVGGQFFEWLECQVSQPYFVTGLSGGIPRYLAHRRLRGHPRDTAKQDVAPTVGRELHLRCRGRDTGGQIER